MFGLGVAVACVVASWAVLVVLARRLPPGVMRDLAAFIPDCVTAIRGLRHDPRVPRRAKIAVVLAAENRGYSTRIGQRPGWSTSAS